MANDRHTIMRRLHAIYDGWLRASPMLTKSVTSAVLFGVGDRIAQRVEQWKNGDDVASQSGSEDEDAENRIVTASTARTLRMMFWGGVLFAPIAHTWVNFVERTVGSSGRVVVTKKILLDMFAFAPCSNTLFYTTTKLLEGERPSDAFDFALQKMPKTLAANYTVWPFANVVTYGVVPLRYRILFINFVSMGWSTFLSLTSSERGSNMTSEDDAHIELEDSQKLVSS